jgi:hypothetical protein
MTNLAHQQLAKIKKWEAITGEPLMRAHFEDGSVLQISMDGNHRRLRTDDPPGTLANGFGAALQPKTGFRIEVNKLVFTFRDGSGLELGLDGSTLYLS